MDNIDRDELYCDVHMHVMNLGHPNILAFINRLSRQIGIREATGRDFLIALARKVLAAAIIVLLITRVPKIAAFLLLIFGLLFLFTFTGLAKVFSRRAIYFIRSKAKPLKNLLAVMENDAGSFFQLIQECLGHDCCLWHNAAHPVPGKKYKKLVLFPMLMDFGYKNIKDSDIHYSPGGKFKHHAWRKPIVEQVVDIFNGIKRYRRISKDHLLEIYPFMGINTANYDKLDDVKALMDKYFGQYESGYELFRDKFFSNINSYNGDIEAMGSFFFAGIKVYPPLGFNPWPEGSSKESVREMEKVNYLYDYCCQRSIPVTTHCNPGGFNVLSPEEAGHNTSPYTWEKVLAEYDKLKLNFAHLGCDVNNMADERWFDKIFQLILKYDNVYGDFSFCGIKPEFYYFLKRKIGDLDRPEREKIMARIMFGSDFMINLLSSPAYYEYLNIFIQNRDFSLEDKHQFCSQNPLSFVFG